MWRDLGQLGLQISTVVTAIQVLVFALGLLVVPRDRHPSASLAWLLLILLLPFVGLALFLLIGSPKVPRKRREKQAGINQRIEERTADLTDLADFNRHPTPAWLPSVAALNQSLGALPLVAGNRATLVDEFDQQVATLVRAVEAARRHVHVEFYILTLDGSTAPFIAALGSAVKRGVVVRVLLDHLGSRRLPGYRHLKRELDRLGVQWRLMLPVQPWRGRYQRPDLRNHRKLLVVDGDVAFIGSLNMVDPSYDSRRHQRRGLRWRDVLVRVEGPVVQQVDTLFASDWYCETDVLLSTPHDHAGRPSGSPDQLLCQVVPSGPRFEQPNNLAMFNSLIYAAQQHVSITSPYFVPDESLLLAITSAAHRGVCVELFVGEIADQFFVFHAQHSYYRTLLEAGVKIYLYPEPAILHAKHVSIDDLVTVVGSSNLDMRSFLLDLELSLLVCGTAFTQQIRRIEDENRRSSRELTLDQWCRRHWAHRALDDLARLTSAVQ